MVIILAINPKSANVVYQSSAIAPTTQQIADMLAVLAADNPTAADVGYDSVSNTFFVTNDTGVTPT